MMRKRNDFVILSLAVAILICPAVAPADVVPEQFFDPTTGETAAGFVFQGSRNMRDLGKRRSSGTISRIVSVPSIAELTEASARTSTSGPEADSSSPQGRFGYGTEPDAAATSPVVTTVEPTLKPSLTPALTYPAPVVIDPLTRPIIFSHNYAPRDYVPVYRHPFGYTPWGYGFGYGLAPRYYPGVYSYPALGFRSPFHYGSSRWFNPRLSLQYRSSDWFISFTR